MSPGLSSYVQNQHADFLEPPLPLLNHPFPARCPDATWKELHASRKSLTEYWLVWTKEPSNLVQYLLALGLPNTCPQHTLASSS